MDQVVVEDELVTGLQSPVTPSQNQKVYCTNCKSGFANQANLKRHEETKHADQNTPEAITKRLQLKEYRKVNTRERRKHDHVYRAKMKQTHRTYRLQKKSRGAVENDDHVDSVDKDVTSKDIPPEVDTQLHEESDHSLGSDSHVKKAHTNDKTRGVFHVTTTALTDENIKAFFSPKYNTPRTKEERKSAPRNSVV